ncbi:MAG: hypothetical protein KC656_17310 [Myxococcales bacterium]|nr:hypothetical protein [Myxococcales bacterium]
MENRIPTAQLLGWTLLWAVVVTASWMTWSGPWRWASEIWVAMFASADVFGPFLLAGCFPWLAGAGVLQVVHHRLGSPVHAGGSGFLDGLEDRKPELVAAMLVCMAVVLGARGVLAGAPVRVTAETVGDAPLHVEVPTAGLVLDAGLVIDDDAVVPWVVDGRVVAAVWLPDRPLPDVAPGMRAVWGAPGVALSTWEERGLQVSPSIPALDLTDSPGKSLGVGGILGVMALVAACVGWVRRRVWPT